MKDLAKLAAVMVMVLAAAGCIQVGPKEEPLHIILDVNIKVQIERDVEDLWDSIERQAEAKAPTPDTGDDSE